ncbi:MAG: tRNA uridine-5-carboxymethylaminomethyl(34) synthesis GTPase MnmE [Bacteroidetes bacterium QS_9_68_14]|nr:MAG: tRNA uridine-5-carboxymethylaminomethyl(34) synthesis GTPase MnmE [Bacteroidetes bacterium QS_9_68_14]
MASPSPTTDTIAALATPRGRAALAVVRLSGPQAVRVADACLSGPALAEAESHTAHVGFFRGAEGEEIDRVVATVFRAPRSATGEDVVELSCHGGDFAPQLILERLYGQGARPAEPGEFTQRGFLNGKMDLAQAEAVADLIDATSRAAHRASMKHLKGRYSDRLAELREELLELCAYIELELDFSDEDVDFADEERLAGLLDEAEALLADLIGSYATGEKLRDGVRVVIGGRPNAGKSTLLNALVGDERAITSPTPGTTRDRLEADAQIEGVRFRFTDTAGLRGAEGQIEAEGVRRAEEAIREADVLLYLYDLAEGLADEERAFLEEHAPGVASAGGDAGEESDGQATLVIGNKADLLNGEAPTPQMNREAAGLPHATLSALEAARDTDRLAPVTDFLRETVAGDLSRAEHSPVVMNRRHRRHLRDARAAVRQVREGLEGGLGGDLLALDLREALDEIGHITGDVTNEDVLDQIFSRFCIGK